jgi:hypothetical protein
MFVLWLDDGRCLPQLLGIRWLVIVYLILGAYRLCYVGGGLHVVSKGSETYRFVNDYIGEYPLP